MDSFKYIILILLFMPNTLWAADIVNDYGTGLVGCWELDETDGARLDSSGNNYSLSDTGNIQDVAGVQGRAADMEASSSTHLSRSDDGTNVGLDLSGGDISVSFWWNPESTSRQFLVSKYSGTGYSFEYNAGSFFLFQRSGAGLNETSVAYTVSTGSFIHVMYVYDDSANDWELYINGTSQGSATMNHTPSNSNAVFYFGANTTGTALFTDGPADVLAIWQGDMTANVSSIYNGGSGIPCVGAGGETPVVPEQDVIIYMLSKVVPNLPRNKLI